MTPTEPLPTAHAAPTSPGVASATAVRCRLYNRFSAAFLHPAAGEEHALASGDWFGAIRDLALELPYADPFAAMEEPASVGIPPLGEIYTSTFDVGQGALSLYGRSYRNRKESDKALFEELFRFYEHFGLDSKDGLAEYPDWIVIELEFMHYLSFIEAETAGASNAASLRRAQRDFIERHLLEFSTGLAAALRDRAIPLYASLAAALSAFVASDLNYLNEGIVLT